MPLAEDVAMFAPLVAHIRDMPLKSKVFHSFDEFLSNLLLVASAAGRAASSRFLFLVARTASSAASSRFLFLVTRATRRAASSRSASLRTQDALSAVCKTK
jgi:hypothetical protein